MEMMFIPDVWIFPGQGPCDMNYVNGIIDTPTGGFDNDGVGIHLLQ